MKYRPTLLVIAAISLALNSEVATAQDGANDSVFDACAMLPFDMALTTNDLPNDMFMFEIMAGETLGDLNLTEQMLILPSLPGMDTDGDSKISKAEFLAEQRREFETLDTNGDGVLVLNELFPEAPDVTREN